jgi:CYTH domain-containing protein
MEIERKFWIQSLPTLPEIRSSDIEQGYLCTEPVELRIRRQKNRITEITTYQLCIKSMGLLSRHEVETELSQAQFEELADMLEQPLICKEYHAYQLEDGYVLECSVVDQGVFSYAEVEFPSEAAALAWNPLSCLGRETTYERGVNMCNGQAFL